MAEASLVKELPPREKIKEWCLARHREFNQKYWQGKESLHDAEHIEATMVAAEMLVEAALKGDDPLELTKDLERWNQAHPGAQVEKEELPEVVALAFACHDLGDIAEKAVTGPEGKVKLVYNDHYRAAGAEDRSQEMAEVVIRSLSGLGDKQARFIPLVRHLINETKYVPAKSVPFMAFTRVVDQIGNSLFNKNSLFVIGLLEETRAESPLGKFPPALFFDFARRRFPDLVSAEGTRNSVLRIWEKELPEEKPDLAEDLQPIADFLDEYRAKQKKASVAGG